MIAIKNVLVATDFSALAGTALAYGRELARLSNGRLHVIHVIDDVRTRLAYADAGVAGLAPMEIQADIEGSASAELERFVDESDRRELRAVTALRMGLSPADEIIEYAKEAGIDVIVIGATGRGLLDRLLMGSTAEKLIRRAPCPVLAVRTPEREFIRPDALQAVESHDRHMRGM